MIRCWRRRDMLGRKERDQPELFIAGSLRQLIPDDHVLVRVDRVLDLSWLREEVADCYCCDDGRPGICGPADACRPTDWFRARPQADAGSARQYRHSLVCWLCA